MIPNPLALLLLSSEREKKSAFLSACMHTILGCSGFTLL